MFPAEIWAFYILVISLGEARLRTETAGIYAVTVFATVDGLRWR